MKGSELSKAYFEEFGLPMLEKDFADLLPYLAVGIVGSGSDRYGFDDMLSRDHDFEPGFCLFLPGEELIDRRNAFLLERAYSKLPKEYNGIQRQTFSPVGGNRNGVFRTADFYASAVGCENGELNIESWLSIPDYALAEAVNGEIWLDNFGEFTAIRNKLRNMPQDVRLKRMTGNLLVMAQSGQYNFSRCFKRGEMEAAQLACQEYVQAAMKVWFHLHQAYMPYYKWSFRALRLLEGGESLAEKLSFLLLSNHVEEAVAAKKASIIEDVAVEISTTLRLHNLMSAPGSNLERVAYAVNEQISDSNIRNLNILAGF